MNEMDAPSLGRTMPDPQPHAAEETRIMLGLLESIAHRSEQSQRRLAVELGVALGLVNAYLKRCINKGLVKVSQIPAHRYAYYLTSRGFAEKSRLTVEYLTSSFSFFRQAKADCAQVFALSRQRGFCRLVLAGRSDLAEIAGICALDGGMTIVAVVDAGADAERIMGVPVVAALEQVPTPFDAVVVTDMTTPAATHAAVVARVPRERVLVPALLRLRAESGGGPDPERGPPGARR
jgi:DNA-binding MarR family transcriptional regulator